MDLRFSPHNTHRESPEAFPDLDPNLRLLKQQPLVHRADLLNRWPVADPGIFTLTGGRQIGKTTLLKQWLADRLADGWQSNRLYYLTGELIDDHHGLVRLITDALAEMPTSGLKAIIVDEVTYVRNWDKGIKFLADAGALEEVQLIVSGSDAVIINEALARFPGRRGQSDVVDFHLHPLSFAESLRLKGHFSEQDVRQLLDPELTVPADSIDRLFDEFSRYLIHGGFLTAINDVARHGAILPATLATYSDWIRGDVLKRHKREHYLREILEAIIKRYGSQVTWNGLAKDLSIDHPQTIADYLALLSAMDAVFIQQALRENNLTAAPKKAKKVMFSDPFIYHACFAWLNPCQDPFSQQITPHLADERQVSTLVETCAALHFRRYYPTYYIKAAGVVDIAYIDAQRFHPVEIKWTRQLRPKSLKQISRYPNGLILTRSKTKGEISNIPTEPLPLALLRLGEQPL